MDDFISKVCCYHRPGVGGFCPDVNDSFFFVCFLALQVHTDTLCNDPATCVNSNVGGATESYI